MRLAPLLLTVALAAPIASIPVSVPAVARADSAAVEAPATEIRLGNPAPAPRKPDPARSKAVERFLSARQDASADRLLAARLRRGLATKEQVSDEILAGPRGATLVAFDFDDADIPRASARPARFAVTATLLFASEDGQMVETRGEELTFVPSGGGYACAKIVPTNVISWNSQTAFERAVDAGIAREMEKLKSHWRRSDDPGQLIGFSLSDVERRADGDVVVSCLRYTSSPGRRGFESDSAWVVITEQNGSFQLKPR